MSELVPNRIKFTDADGIPISWEAFETNGFTQGMQLPGQMCVMIKCKKGAIMMAAKIDEEADLAKLVPLLWKEFQKENVK